MIVDGIEFDVIYIDPDITITSGNGSTPSNALKTFPSALVDNTCYLIRRTDATSAAFPMGSSAVSNVFLLGMPKSDDLYYSIIPDEAKTAWDSDTADYANILFDRSSLTNPTDSWTATAQHYCILTAVKYFNLRNVRCHRIGSTTQQRGPGFMFSITSTQNGDYKIANCHFGCNYTLINDTFAENNASIDSTFNQMYGQYITFNTAKKIIFDNNIIDAAGQNTDYSKMMHSFSFRGTIVNLYITNNTLNHLGFLTRNTLNADINCTLSVFNSYTNTVINLIVNNNTFVDVYQNSKPNLSSFICINNNLTGIATIHNNKFKQLVFKDYVTSSSLGTYNKIQLKAFLGIDIDNLSAKYTDTLAGQTSANFLYVEGQAIGCPGNVIRSIKNINIELLTTSDILPSNGCVVSILGYRAYSASYEYDSNRAITNYPITLENINIKTLYDAIKLDTCNMISADITGGVALVYNSYANIDNLVNLRANRLALNCENDGDVVRIKKLTVPSDAVLPQITYQSKNTAGIGACSIIVEEASINPFVTYVSQNLNGYDRNCVFLCNNFEDGKFFAKNSTTYAESHSTSRTGSLASASLKLCNTTTDNSNYYMELGNNILRGFNKTIASGTYDFTCYLSEYNLGVDQLLDRFDIIIDVPQNDGSNLSYVLSNGYILNDTSTWSDENVTAYKAVIPNVVIPKTILGVAQNVTVNIRLRFNAYSANEGYMYVDPDFTFTSK